MDVQPKDALAGEAHHRIANSLALVASFVRLQAASLGRGARSLSPGEARLLLDEVGARIETIARLNRLLSFDATGGRVDLAPFLNAICEVLTETVGAQSLVAIHCQAAPGVEMASERAEPIAMIVSELVTNAVKYAHPAGAPGRIEVSCARETSGALTVSVADDGVGLPEGFDSAKHGGFGMRVVRSLAKQLGAEIAFHGHPLGLTVTVTIPPVGGIAPAKRAPIALVR